MSRFRIEAQFNDTKFVVQIKFLLWWFSGFVWTNYFSITYDSLEDAQNAIDRYIDRFSFPTGNKTGDSNE